MGCIALFFFLGHTVETELQKLKNVLLKSNKIFKNAWREDKARTPSNRSVNIIVGVHRPYCGG